MKVADSIISAMKDEMQLLQTKTKCEVEELRNSKKIYLQYREEGYPDLDEGIQDLLDQMYDRGFIPRWCCTGHNEDGSDGYVAFVTLDYPSVFEWFMKTKWKFQSELPGVFLEMEFGNLMLSSTCDNSSEYDTNAWSIAFRWSIVKGYEEPLNILMKTLKEV